MSCFCCTVWHYFFIHQKVCFPFIFSLLHGATSAPLFFLFFLLLAPADTYLESRMMPIQIGKNPTVNCFSAQKLIFSLSTASPPSSSHFCSTSAFSASHRLPWCERVDGGGLCSAILFQVHDEVPKRFLIFSAERTARCRSLAFSPLHHPPPPPLIFACYRRLPFLHQMERRKWIWIP